MGSNFTNFPDGCHGPVPLETAICSEERRLFVDLSWSTKSRAITKSRFVRSAAAIRSVTQRDQSIFGARVTSLILREKRWTAGSSTFSVDAWFLSLFRHISGCFKSKMGAECALRQTRANASSSLSAHGCHRLLDPPS